MEKVLNKTLPEREFRPYRRPLSIPLANAKETIQQKIGYLLRERLPGQAWRYAEATPLETLSSGQKEFYEDLLIRWQKNDPSASSALANDALFGFSLWCLSREIHDETAAKSNRMVQCSTLLPAGSRALQVFPSLLEKGYRTFKWKVGVEEVPSELKIAEQLFARASEEVRFRLDANQCWTLSQAKEWSGFLRDAPVEYVEEPLSPGQDKELLALADSFPVSLALDERLRLEGGFRRWIELSWPGFYVIKPSLCGSVSSWWKLLEKRGGLSRVVLSSALETGIGARHLLYLARELPGEVPHGLGVGDLFKDESPPLSLEEKPFYTSTDLVGEDNFRIWEEAGLL